LRTHRFSEWFFHRSHLKHHKGWHYSGCSWSTVRRIMSASPKIGNWNAMRLCEKNNMWFQTAMN
jgi:hypothetical protein